MNLTTNPAFDFLRKYKTCAEDTEDFVMKRVKYKFPNLTSKELLTIFEGGISGQYGKVYTADPQTIIGWVDAYHKAKNNSQNYLSTGLLPLTFHPNEIADWDKEANKCLTAFLNGVSENQFHPCVYDRMMLDGKIQINGYMKYFKATGNEKEDVMAAKQKVIRDSFLTHKANGWNQVYFIK